MKRKRVLTSVFSIVMAVVLGFTLISCGGQENVVPGEENAPVITVTSANPASVYVGDTYILAYTLENATSSNVVASGGTYNSETKQFTADAAGSYILTITAANAEKVTTKTVTINVSEKNEPEEEKTPVITVTSANPAFIGTGDAYTLEYTAENTTETKVVASGGTYNEETKQFTADEAGTYTLTITAKNVIKEVTAVVTIEVLKEITETEAYEKLSSGIYKEAMNVSSDIGLSDASEVGVDPDAFTYVADEVPEDSQFVGIFNASDYGISPTSDDNISGFDKLISALKSTEGMKKVVFGNGEYKVSTTVLFENINDLWLVGDETVLLLTAWDTAVEISSCQNFHMNGISIDYENSPSLAGEVVSASGKNLVFRPYDNYDLSYSRYAEPFAYGSYIEYISDGAGSYCPNPSGNLRYNSTGDGIKNINSTQVNVADGTVSVTFKNNLSPAPAAGTKVSLAFTMYEYTGMWFHDSQDIYLEGVNIYAAPGMGITFERNRNITMNRTNVTLPEGKNRLMTATADGFHFKGTEGELNISGCLIENTHDDGINVCYFYKTVTSYSLSQKKVTLSIDNSERNFNIYPGDKLDFYRPENLELVTSATVVSAEKTGPMTWEVVLKERLTQDIVGLLVGNDTQTAQVTIENCIFRNKRNRGVILQSRRSIITNCAFVNVLHGSVLISATRDIFGEAILPADITVQNCKFINNGSNDIWVCTWGSAGTTAGAIERVRIDNNAFINSYTKISVLLKGVGDGTIIDNLFLNPQKQAKHTAISAEKTIGLSVMGNRMYLTNKLSQESVLLQLASGEQATVFGNTVYNANLGV